MASLGGWAVLGGKAVAGRPAEADTQHTDLQPSAAQPAERVQPGLSAGPLWMRVVPPLVTLVVTVWGIGGPSYIPDEAATLSAIHRSFPDLVRMLGNVDAVHGAYYIFMWVVVRLGGAGELATRLPSALAMATAAAGVVALGRRLVSPRAGLAAGLVFACLPLVSFYGQDARPYAIMTALATLASYLLVRVLDAGPGRRLGWLAAYGACLAALGMAQMFGLLLIAAHATTVALRCRPGSDEPARRSLALGWLAAAAAATAADGPVIALGWIQRGPMLAVIGTVSWQAKIVEFIGSWALVLVIGLVLALTVAASAVTGRLRACWPGRLPALCLPWLILPPVLLIVGSALSSPMYALRYVIFCEPAIALLAGAALAALGWAAGTATLAVIVAVALPVQLQFRSPTGHGRNLRKADQIIAAHERPGDAVLFGTRFGQYQRFAYPYGLVSLRDIALVRTPAQAGTLTGTTVHGQALGKRLGGVSRVWLIGGNGRLGSPLVQLLARAGFRPVQVWRIPLSRVQLYVRRQGSG